MTAEGSSHTLHVRGMPPRDEQSPTPEGFGFRIPAHLKIEALFFSSADTESHAWLKLASDVVETLGPGLFTKLNMADDNVKACTTTAVLSAYGGRSNIPFL